MTGVRRFSWQLPGPRVGIMAVTHWDEPSGLAAVTFLEDYFSTNPPELGEIFLILGNPDAAKSGKICLESNLNRLFLDDSQLSDSQKASMEYRRSRELMPLLESLDFLLDIHSTNNPGPVFSIAKTESPSHFAMAARLPVSFYSHNWNDFIIGTTGDWVDRFGGIGIAVECWSHQDIMGGEVAIACAKTFLQNIGVCDFGLSSAPFVPGLTIYGRENVISPQSFQYNRYYENFERLAPWECIAHDDTKDYLAPNEEGLLIVFPTNIKSIRSGAIKEAFLIGKYDS